MKPAKLTLVVGDFGIKYMVKKHLEYGVEIDETGSLY